MANPAAPSEALHMSLAAYAAVGFAVAAIHAAALRRRPGHPLHRRAFAIAFGVGAVAALLQPLSGDQSARQVARYQWVKLAALEGQWRTERGAPLRLGGWPDARAHVTRHALEIPHGLSLLARHDPDAVVRGLDDAPAADRPPVAIVHVAFQVMVACGAILAGIAALGLALARRRRGVPDAPWFLRLVTWAGPLGFVALEAGWTVTEVGRQPWIVHGVMRTADAVTPMPYLIAPFLTFSGVYLLLGIVVVILLRRLVFATVDAGGASSGGGGSGASPSGDD